MKYKIINGNRKHPKMFAKFVERLRSRELEADSNLAMRVKVDIILDVLKLENPRCDFYIQGGNDSTVTACWLYENRNAYLSKSYLIAVTKDE